MTALAIMLVGTSELQDEKLRDTTTRSAARELAALTDDELVEVLGDATDHRSLRNSACFQELDNAHDSNWSLLMIGTDQPEDVAARYRDNDTLPLAEQLQRWFQLVRPGVRVLPPIGLRNPPHLGDEPLEEEIKQAVVSSVDACKPDRLYLLLVGATPAMRVLTDWFARQSSVRRVVDLQPVQGTSGAVRRMGLLRVEAVERSTRTLIHRQTVRGDFAGALETLDEFGPDTDADVDQLRALLTIASNICNHEAIWATADDLTAIDPACRRELEQHGITEPSWCTRVAAMADQLHVLQESGHLRDAVVLLISAADTLPVAWLEVRLGEVANSDEIWNATKPLRGAHSSKVGKKAERSIGVLARLLFECLRPKCGRQRNCKHPAVERLHPTLAILTRRENSIDPRAIGAIRYGGLNDLRNAWVHPEFRPGRPEIHEAEAAVARSLRKSGIDVTVDPMSNHGMADLVRTVLSRFDTEQAAPLMTVMSHIGRVLG